MEGDGGEGWRVNGGELGGRMGVRNEDMRLDSPPQVAAPSMKLSDISGIYVNYYTFQGKECILSNFIVRSWD